MPTALKVQAPLAAVRTRQVQRYGFSLDMSSNVAQARGKHIWQWPEDSRQSFRRFPGHCDASLRKATKLPQAATEVHGARSHC